METSVNKTVTEQMTNNGSSISTKFVPTFVGSTLTSVPTGFPSILAVSTEQQRCVEYNISGDKELLQSQQHPTDQQSSINQLPTDQPSATNQLLTDRQCSATQQSSTNQQSSATQQSSTNQQSSATQQPSTNQQSFANLESQENNLSSQRQNIIISNENLDQPSQPLDTSWHPKPCNIHDIVTGVLDLYSKHPRRELFGDNGIYAKNAVFEDPLMCLNGRGKIRSSFRGIDKFFSESTVLKYKVDLEQDGRIVASSEPSTIQETSECFGIGKTQTISNSNATQNTSSNTGGKQTNTKTKHAVLPVSRRAILIWMDMRYRVKSFTKEMTTLIRLFINDDGLIVRHEDLWHGQELNNWNNKGFLGGSAKVARVAHGYVYAFFFTVFCSWW